MIVAARSRWKRWGKFAILTGACLVAIVAIVGMRHRPASRARVPVIGRVVEIKPQVDGPVIAVAAEPNVLVHKGSVLLQIDPAPYETRLKQVESELVAAHGKIDRLKSELASAETALATIQAQYDDIARELGQAERHPGTGTGIEFRLLYIQDEQELVATQLRMAKEQVIAARRAFAAQIGGANLSAAQLAVELADAHSHVDQATIRAPADGYVSRIDVAVGARAVTTRSAVSFIAADEITDRERFLAGQSPTPKLKRGRKHHTLAGRIRTLLR